MIAGLILAAAFVAVLFAAWLYDRRHRGVRVHGRDADTERRIAESSFESYTGRGADLGRH